MGDISVKTEVINPQEDHSWLGSRHGLAEANSDTIDRAITETVFTDGYVPSGVVLGRVTATGRLVPYTDAATHGVGSDTAVGHLAHTVSFPTGSTGNPSCAILWHGEVVVDNLPTDNGLTTAARADLDQVHYV